MINNLKKLMDEMDSRSDFIEELAKQYGMSAIYIQRQWFQREWKVPVEKLEEIVKMAQKWLYQQNNRKNKILEETGFKPN